MNIETALSIVASVVSIIAAVVSVTNANSVRKMKVKMKSGDGSINSSGDRASNKVDNA